MRRTCAVIPSTDAGDGAKIAADSTFSTPLPPPDSASTLFVYAHVVCGRRRLALLSAAKHRPGECAYARHTWAPAVANCTNLHFVTACLGHEPAHMLDDTSHHAGENAVPCWAAMSAKVLISLLECALYISCNNQPLSHIHIRRCRRIARGKFR